jgi:hypothetical protein
MTMMILYWKRSIRFGIRRTVQSWCTLGDLEHSGGKGRTPHSTHAIIGETIKSLLQ